MRLCDAAVAEVAVHHAAIIVGVGQLAKFAQISAEFFGSDCRIFPSFPRRRFAGNARNRAQRGFPDLPGLSCLTLVSEQPEARRMRASAERFHQPTRLRFGFSAMSARQTPPAAILRLQEAAPILRD